jgi:hypothetical protein
MKENKKTKEVNKKPKSIVISEKQLERLIMKLSK